MRRLSRWLRPIFSRKNKRISISIRGIFIKLEELEQSYLSELKNKEREVKELLEQKRKAQDKYKSLARDTIKTLELLIHDESSRSTEMLRKEIQSWMNELRMSNDSSSNASIDTKK